MQMPIWNFWRPFFPNTHVENSIRLHIGLWWGNHILQYQSNIWVPLVSLKIDMMFIELLLFAAQIQFREINPMLHIFHLRVWDNIAIQGNTCIVQSRLYIITDNFIQLNFAAGEAIQIRNTLRINKRHILMLAYDKPYDKIRIESTIIKESNTFTTFVAK